MHSHIGSIEKQAPENTEQETEVPTISSMGVQAALAILLFFVATVSATGGVTFWRKTFTLTCPEEGDWYKEKTPNKLTLDPSSTYEDEYDNKKKGIYYCQYGEDNSNKKTYYFYVQGKVCEDCFELDGTLFALIICVDVVGTAGLMLLIFRCTKKKSSAAPSFTPKAPARSGGRGPPVPSPDYEQLNVNTRSQDTYSMVNRTG